jgi:hypothetical protein
MAARAHWAHLNTFEAFPPFAAGVLIAQQLGAAQARIDALAIAFVALYLIYGVCYLADQATLRSLFLGAGFACTVALFVHRRIKKPDDIVARLERRGIPGEGRLARRVPDVRAAGPHGITWRPWRPSSQR